MKYELKLRSLNYCNVEITLVKESIVTFDNIDDIVKYIVEQNLYVNEDMLFCGDYFLDIDFTDDCTHIKEFIEKYINEVDKFEKS